MKENETKKIYYLPIQPPLTELATNDAHLFAIAGTNQTVLNSLAIGSIGINFGVFTDPKNKQNLYDCNITINSDFCMNHTESPKDIYPTLSSFTKHIYDTLLSDTYLILDIDAKKIEEYQVKGDEILIHSLMVSGINLEKNIVQCSDYFGFRRYCTKEINIDLLYNAYCVIQEYNLQNTPLPLVDDWIRLTSRIKLIESDGIDYTKQFIENATEYLNPKINILTGEVPSSYYYVYYKINNNDTSPPLSVKSGFGIHIYNFLIDYVSDSYSSEKFGIVKAISILENHFKILEKAIYIVLKNDTYKTICIEEITILKKDACLIKNLIIKRFISNKKEKDNIITLLIKIKCREEKLLIDLIEHLS